MPFIYLEKNLNNLKRNKMEKYKTINQNKVEMEIGYIKEEAKQLTDLEIAIKLEEIKRKEPKKEYQTCKCGSNWFNTTVADKPFCFKCGESVKEDFKPTKENCTCTDECLGYLTKTCKGIEETALRLYPNRESFLDRFQDIEREAFIKGYKLAQERSYSEEEVLDILLLSYSSISDKSLAGADLRKWFEQFKKK